MSIVPSPGVPPSREPRRTPVPFTPAPLAGVPPRADSTPAGGNVADTPSRYDRRGGARGEPFALPAVADSPPPQRASRERGAVIAGRYVVERELGHGGMATVL